MKMIKKKVMLLMSWTNQVYSLVTKNPSNKKHLILLYRYISLILTSFFFLLGTPQFPYVFKLGVIISLSIAAWILSDLQKKNIENQNILKVIVLTETIGLTLLLIPTGGITSPFIWYALNPVLVAASFLTPLFYWGVLAFYLFSATFIAFTVFNSGHLISIIQDNSYIYLVCLLSTFLVMLFSGLTKELDSKATILRSQHEQLLLVNQKLTATNEMYKETLEHIMSLYHLMDHFSSNKNPENLTSAITSALIKCTQKQHVFFWLIDLHGKNKYLSNTTTINHIEDEIKKDWHNFSHNKQPFINKLNGEYFWMKIVRTSKNVGVLGMKVKNDHEVKNTFLLNRTFEFMADLSEIMLERIHMEQIIDQFIIIEEQNRIANELHDTVSQKLFGIVYSLHSLQMNSNNISKNELNQEYRFLVTTANSSIKELRAAIYRLSSVKKGEKPFFVLVKNYLDEYARLNNIKIYHEFIGNDLLIPNRFKLELYRIICEACGNAVRHGECNVIDMRLSVTKDKISIFIQDDGIGIQLKQPNDIKGKGLGLFNMQNVVNSFGGTFSLDGINGYGTIIQIEIPIGKMFKKQEVFD